MTRRSWAPGALALFSVPLSLFFGAANSNAQDIRVTAVQVLADPGGRVSWARPTNVIAYDAPNSAGYFEVWQTNPDGSNNFCLTCSAPALPPLNKGNPIWNPAGSYLVIQVQQEPSLGTSGDVADRPGSGWNNDLWATDAQGHFWKLTNEPAVTGGVIYPTFSWDGTKLAYGERLSPSPDPFGTWHIVVADFVVTNGVPSLQNPQIYQPGDQKFYYEPHGFSLDDGTLFFMAYLQPGQSPYAMDIYSLNLSTGDLVDLTNTPHAWDEHPTPFLSGSRMMYMSTLDTGSTTAQGFCDFYLMNYDGSNKLQLTFRNDPLSPDYLSTGVCLADPSWNKDGSQFVAYANSGFGPVGIGASWIFAVEPANPVVSSASFARPPLAAESIVATFGTNFSTQNYAASGSSLTNNLGGTSMTVTDAKGVVRNAPLYFVSSGQINSVIPSGTALGPAVFEVTNPDGVKTRSTVNIGSVSPAFYTINATGSGAAAAYVLRYQSNGSQSSENVYSCPSGAQSCTTAPINTNSSDQLYLVLFGSGLRGRSSLNNVFVTFQNDGIGSRTVAASYVGPQGDGSIPGFDQVNVQIPRSLAGAGVVNITVTADGIASNPVQIQLQ